MNLVHSLVLDQSSLLSPISTTPGTGFRQLPP